MDKRLMTIGETATHLGISVSHLYKMCSIRSIDFYKIGRSNKFLIEDLDDFIAKRKVVKQTKSNYNLRPFVKL
jgi:excisionase family DNA binding protein